MNETSKKTKNEEEKIAELLSRASQFSTAARILAERRLEFPALALLYTSLDILGWSCGWTGETVETSFVRWVQDFFLPGTKITCNAKELYAARCAILHTLTAESRLSREKGVKILVYAWGTGTAHELQRTVDRLRQNAVAVHIDELLDAQTVAIERFFQRLLTDEKLRVRFVTRTESKWFKNVPLATIRDFLGVTDEYKKIHAAIDQARGRRPWEK